MDADPRRRLRWANVLFGVAAVSTFAMMAVPFSAYAFGRFLGTVAMAFVARLLYVKVRRRAQLPIWSGWIFVLALGAAFLVRAGQQSDAVEQSSKAAVEHRVVASQSAATPRDRCVGLALEDYEAHVTSRVHLRPRTIRIFVRRVCARADSDGVLAQDGSIPPTSARALGNEVAVEMRAEGLLR